MRPAGGCFLRLGIDHAVWDPQPDRSTRWRWGWKRRARSAASLGCRAASHGSGTAQRSRAKIRTRPNWKHCRFRLVQLRCSVARVEGRTWRALKSAIELVTPLRKGLSMVCSFGSRLIYRNPLELSRISYSDIISNVREGVYIEEPGTPRVFSRAPPVFHDDPDGIGLFPPFHEMTVTYPPVFTVSQRNVTLVGFRSIITKEGYFVNDLGHLTPEDTRSFIKGLAQSNELGPLSPMLDEGAFSCCLKGCQEAHLEGPVVVLGSVEPGNFSSFLARDLIKLINLVEVPPDWRFLLCIASSAYTQFLELAGVPAERVINQDIHVSYHIDQAIIPGLRPYAMADPQTRAFHARLRAKCDKGVRGRRIYVSRRSASAARPNGRVMLNEEELIEHLQRVGFEIVEAEHLSAKEQIGVFASAGLIVGPSGSGMFNCVFCHPGAKVIDIESEPHWIFPHSSLFASSGLHYGIFEGRATDRDWTVHHKPWLVNIEALLERITAFADCTNVTPVEAMETTGPKAVQAAGATTFWSVPDLAGEDYRLVLERFHSVLSPQSYLEIGVADGASLELAVCSAIGVDPHFGIQLPIRAKPVCSLFSMTSDRFFAEYNPSAIFGRPIDMAFLDGLHRYEFLLRDFINTEKHCKANSIILLHDCIPTDEYIGRRDIEDQWLRNKSAHPELWAGDVWKVLAVLIKYRPDLRIAVFNAYPTGLVAVTRLDSSSMVLTEQYFSILEEYRDQTLGEHGSSFLSSLEILDTRQCAGSSALTARFWL